MHIVTLRQRKDREAGRRREAVEHIRARLLEFARSHGGRFLIYGSAARGEMRYNSDLDILIDMPEPYRADAWELVERLSSQHGLPVDIGNLKATSPDFRDHVMKHAVVVE